MNYKYTYEQDIPAMCELTLNDLQLLRELTSEAIKEEGSGYRYEDLNRQLLKAIKALHESAISHFSWQKTRLATEERLDAEAKAEA